MPSAYELCKIMQWSLKQRVSRYDCLYTNKCFIWSKMTPMALKKALDNCVIPSVSCADLTPTRANKYWRLHADELNSYLHAAWPCVETNKRQVFLRQHYFKHVVIESLSQLMIAMPIVSIPVMIAFPAALGVYWVSLLFPSCCVMCWQSIFQQIWNNFNTFVNFCTYGITL